MTAKQTDTERVPIATDPHDLLFIAAMGTHPGDDPVVTALRVFADEVGEVLSGINDRELPLEKKGICVLLNRIYSRASALCDGLERLREGKSRFGRSLTQETLGRSASTRRVQGACGALLVSKAPSNTWHPWRR